MSGSQQPSPLSRLGDETDRLASDLRELLAAHVDLARLEAKAATRSAIRLAIMMGIAVAAILSGIATLAVLSADVLSRATSTDPGWWLLAFGIGSVVTGCVVGLLGRSRFRNELAELSGIFEELREDAYWLGQWFGQSEAPENDKS